MKIQVTAQQRANAIEARDLMVPSIPAENLAPNLSYWGSTGRREEVIRTRKACGAVACFGGWCTIWPSFREQGVTTAYAGSWEPALKGDPYASAGEVSFRLFGDSALFCPRLSRAVGDSITERGSETKIILRRLNKLIKNSKVQA